MVRIISLLAGALAVVTATANAQGKVDYLSLFCVLHLSPDSLTSLSPHTHIHIETHNTQRTDATAPVCDTTVMITLLTKATATMPDQTTAGQITEACFGLIGQDVSQLTDEQICSCFGPLPASAVTPEMDSLQCLGTPTSPMTIYETWVQW